MAHMVHGHAIPVRNFHQLALLSGVENGDTWARRGKRVQQSSPETGATTGQFEWLLAMWADKDITRKWWSHGGFMRQSTFLLGKSSF